MLCGALWYKLGYEESYEPAEKPLDSIPINPSSMVMGKSTPSLTSQIVTGIPVDTWAAPVSEWHQQTKTRAANSLRLQASDLVVLPVQGGANAFDPIERRLIARLIADRIGSDRKTTVANFDDVVSFMGVHKRAYSLAEQVEVAQVAGATHVLSLTAEHNRKGKWTLKSSLLDVATSSVASERSWPDLSYSDVRPPHIEIESIIVELTEHAIGKPIGRRYTRAEFKAADLDFTDSLDALQGVSSSSPVHNAAVLQLLAGLYPNVDFGDARDRLLERSLIALASVREGAPFKRYFQARALLSLGRRPVAEAVLSQPEGVHELTLAAAINGNLTDLEELVPEVEGNGLRFLSAKDLYLLEERYRDSADDHQIAHLADAHPEWSGLILRSIGDLTFKRHHTAAEVKLALEELLPVEGGALMGEAAKAMVTGDLPDEIDIVRLAVRHIATARQRVDEQRAESGLSAEPTISFDLLDLAESTLVANLVASIRRSLDRRDLPEEALEKINAHSAIFSGHSEISFLHGRALDEQAEQVDGVEAQRLKSAAADATLNGFYWAGRVSREGAAASRAYFDLLNASSVGMPPEVAGSAYGPLSERYYEWPRAVSYFTRLSPGEAMAGLVQDCIDYLPASFYCVKYEIARNTPPGAPLSDLGARVLKKYEHRFRGDPQRIEFDVQSALADGDREVVMKMLSERVDADGSQWSAHYALGREHFRQGNFKAASDSWGSYSGFKRDIGIDAVTLGNTAERPGSHLYWVGQFELAAPFYELTVSTQTGSGSQMAAAQRLALIEGDLATAADWAASRVRRYDSKFGLRDLLQLLHIAGEHEIAWEVFDQALQNRTDAQVWSGALVGHRMDRMETSDIVAWLSESPMRMTGVMKDTEADNSVDLAPRYLLLAGTMDRGPDKNLSEMVSAAFGRERPVVARYPESALYSNEIELAYAVDNGEPQSHDRFIANAVGGPLLPEGAKLDWRYTIAARAMSAFSAADYDEAYSEFSQIARYYWLDEYLPYLAFSAAKSGNAEAVHEALLKREPRLEATRRRETLTQNQVGYRFDEEMAYAVLAAFDDRHEDALQHLTAALTNKPFINERTIYPIYEIVDIADRLFEETGRTEYREFALDLSRRHAVILPMYAWAYFVVAKYSQSETERINSTASGLALDPMSERGSKLPDDVLGKARKVLESAGAPFLRRSANSANRGV